MKAVETIVNVVKIGGSVITNKSKPFSLRHNIIKNIAREIALAYSKCKSKIVLIHGGGSFGHYIVKEHGGLNTMESILQTIWYMRELNMIFTDYLHYYNVPGIPMDTHSIAFIDDGKLEINIKPIRKAINNNFIPILYGDIIFTDSIPTILSGDEIAWYLAKELRPSRLLFATSVKGIYDKDPSKERAKLLNLISLKEIKDIDVGKSHGYDVTGGMKKKLLLGTFYACEGILEVIVFSGLEKNNVYKAICGYNVEGTRIIL